MNVSMRANHYSEYFKDFRWYLLQSIGKMDMAWIKEYQHRATPDGQIISISYFWSVLIVYYRSSERTRIRCCSSSKYLFNNESSMLLTKMFWMAILCRFWTWLIGIDLLSLLHHSGGHRHNSISISYNKHR